MLPVYEPVCPLRSSGTSILSVPNHREKCMVLLEQSENLRTTAYVLIFSNVNLKRTFLVWLLIKASYGYYLCIALICFYTSLLLFKKYYFTYVIFILFFMCSSLIV